MVGLDGAWVSDFAKQGAIADLSKLMTDANYDASQLASQVQINGKTYMIPVVNFVYPLFVNKDLLTKAGVTGVPGHAHRVPGRGQEDQRVRRQRQGLGAPARHRRTQRHPERRDVLAVGVRRQHARRTASPT